MASMKVGTDIVEYDGRKKEAMKGGIINHTLNPTVTLSSVVGIYYNGGVLLATDKQGSFGSMQYIRNLDKITKINNNIIYASSGDLSDYQEIARSLQQMERKSRIFDDGVTYGPKDYWNYVARLEYQQRNKFNPYYLNNVIAGFQNGERFLGSVDYLGTPLENSWIVTGMAGYFCKPIITNYWNPECDEATAFNIIKECFKTLFCRDSSATDRIQIARIDATGVKIEDVRVEVQWEFSTMKNFGNEKLNAEII